VEEEPELFGELLGDFNSMEYIMREFEGKIQLGADIDALESKLMRPRTVQRVKDTLKLSRGFSHEIIMSTMKIPMLFFLKLRETDFK
jgi:hypothetical protein